MTAVQHARERSFSASVLIGALLFVGCASGGGAASREPVAPDPASAAAPATDEGAEDMSRSKSPEEPVAAGDVEGREVPPLPSSSPPARPALTPAQQAAFAAAPTVYVERHGTAKLEGLQIHVDSLEEKRDTDGHELMIVELTVRAGDRVTQLRFSGEKGVPQAFAGHLVQCRGGSRQAIGLAVIRAAGE
jgi:hypothetical protein